MGTGTATRTRSYSVRLGRSHKIEKGLPQEQCKDSTDGSSTCKGTWDTHTTFKGTWDTHFGSQHAPFFSLSDERGVLISETRFPGALACGGSLAAALAWFLWQTLRFSGSYSRQLAQPLSMPLRACASHSRSIHSLVLHYAVEVHS